MRMNAKKVSLNSFSKKEIWKWMNESEQSAGKLFRHKIWKTCNRIEEKSGAEVIKNTEKSYECKICMDNQLTVAL